MVLPDPVKKLIDARVFATIATINPDASPQASVVWVKRDGDDVLFSTVIGRHKTRNIQRDPRVSVVLIDPENPYQYAEIRGTVSLTTEGGPELIEELSQRYTGSAFREKGTRQRSGWSAGSLRRRSSPVRAAGPTSTRSRRLHTRARVRTGPAAGTCRP